MTILRSALVFSLLMSLKVLSKIFYRHEFGFIGDLPKNEKGKPLDPWNVRLVVFLNHTSLFEPVFLGVVPPRFIWRLAAHGVVPAADKTTDRPLVGLIFRFVAHNVIAITRQRDNTWFEVLNKIDPKSMVVIAPEGRMKRANGLDLNGKPMTVRGGVADILQAMGSGRMLIAYSGGLHHVQVPGHAPRVFKTVRLRVENVDIAPYIAEMLRNGGEAEFKKNVMRDMDARRDANCPEEAKLSEKIA
ncbi:MAG TPA: 1-acyl-sn-glycerol-3-phosphate acyltransferase [Thermoanaerobaculia bacterium]